jgi:hypothetical protein
VKRFWVIGPEYEYVEPILDDGSGPSEWVRDCVKVEAQDRRDARVLGVQLLKREPFLRRYRDECPFKGVQVKEWS